MRTMSAKDQDFSIKWRKDKVVLNHKISTETSSWYNFGKLINSVIWRNFGENVSYS